MRVEGIKQLSMEDIETRSELLLKLCRRDHLDYSLPTPFSKIIEVLSANGVQFDFQRTLGFSDNGQRIIGATNLKKHIVLLDSSLKWGTHRFNFTLAHELGH